MRPSLLADGPRPTSGRTLIPHPDLCRLGHRLADRAAPRSRRCSRCEPPPSSVGRQRHGPICRPLRRACRRARRVRRRPRRARHGRRSAALAVVGEPGIGKTRLLAELAARPTAAGSSSSPARRPSSSSDLPFWVFVDALDEYVRGLDPRGSRARRRRAGRARAGLPGARRRSRRRARALQHERYRSHRAVRELLEAARATQPLVLVLDDLHWADSGSIELLGALLRRPPAAPVLLALAMRPHQVPERLCELARARAARRNARRGSSSAR